MTKTRKFKTSHTRESSSVTAVHATYRNLSEHNLGGVIFVCKNNNLMECITNQLFGLPAHHFIYVMNINPGMPLFLFNISDRHLYGIFEAASPGRFNMNPYALTPIPNGSRNQYLAQVKVNVRFRCLPLSERIFKPAILDNYYNQTRFWFELDHDQTRRLMHLFSYGPIYDGPHVNNYNTGSRFDEIEVSLDDEDNVAKEKENMIISQLVQSFEEMKTSNEERVGKIDSIQQKLIDTELEIEKLKERCEILEYAIQSYIWPY